MKIAVGMDLSRPEGDETRITIAKVGENGTLTVIDDYGPARNPLKRRGSRFVTLGDDEALDLGLERFNRDSGWLVGRYIGKYDKRRVKRARRAAVRYGFTPQSAT